MRRDYFSLDVIGTDWIESGDDPARPTVIIDFDGPASLLEKRFTGVTSEFLEGTEIDVSFRYLTDRNSDNANGVVSITDRMTGDYVLELNAPADRVLSFIRAAHEYGSHSSDDDRQYRIEIQIGGESIIAYDKQIFLIYDHEGSLLRERSLIPNGVEL